MGEKEPFKDKSITHGYCEDCLAEILLKAREYHREQDIAQILTGRGNHESF